MTVPQVIRILSDRSLPKT